MFFAAVPAFRGLVLLIAGGAVVLVAAFMNHTAEQRAETERKVQVASTLIRADQLQFANITLGPNYGSWKLQGTVQNNGATDLIAFVMRVTVQDCSPSCITIGEQDAPITSINVPPSQARAFEIHMSFPNMPSPKQMRWFYRVSQVYGRPQ
jgi:hypothetical protein